VVPSADGRSIRFLTQLTSTDGSLGMPDATDPSVWYDSRFHRSAFAEASVMGLATTESGIMTAAPYRVVDGASGHWVFAGTGLRDGDLFGIRSLHERCPGGASGHETDKRTAQTPADYRLLAKGTNPDDGGAVFNVGSITYVPSLLVDEPLSRITRNVVERFLA
jgi:hypothetical protein